MAETSRCFLLEQAANSAGAALGGIVKSYSIALAIVLVVIAAALVASVVLLLTNGR